MNKFQEWNNARDSPTSPACWFLDTYFSLQTCNYELQEVKVVEGVTGNFKREVVSCSWNLPTRSGCISTVVDLWGNKARVSLLVPLKCMVFPWKWTPCMSTAEPSPIMCQETLSSLHMVRPGWFPNRYPLIAEKGRRYSGEKNSAQILYSQMGMGCICF